MRIPNLSYGSQMFHPSFISKNNIFPQAFSRRSMGIPIATTRLAGTGGAAACAIACAAACIGACFWNPTSSACESCTDTCMDSCTDY